MRLILACVLLCLSYIKLHSQEFKWSSKTNFASKACGTYIVNDQANNVYIVGSKWDQTTQSGTQRSFIAKFNSDGAPLWSISHPGHELRIAQSGNLFLVSGADSTGCFISKYDSLGNRIKNLQLIPPNIGFIRGVAIDNNNNYIITGIFKGTISFGSNTFVNSSNAPRLFTVKYDQNDVCLWAQVSTSGALLFHHTIYIDQNNNVFIGGDYNSLLTVNGFTLNSTSGDGFILKYSSGGGVQWLKSITGLNYGERWISSITGDNFGNIYILGSYDQATTIGTTTLDLIGASDIFLAQLNINNGEPNWVKTIGGNNEDYAEGLGTTTTGNVFFTGYYSKSITIGNVVLTSESNVTNEPFIALYNSEGTNQWAVRTGCTTGSNGKGKGISRDINDNFYITGNFEGSILFNNKPLTSQNSTMFVAKFFDDEILSLKNKAMLPISNLNLFPIPSTGEFLLEFTATNSIDLQVFVFDQKGLKVYDESIEDFKDSYSHRFDFSKLPKGVYLIQVLSGNNLITQKQVIN